VVDELLTDQGPQCLPDRDEADTEELGDVIEGYLRPRRGSSVEDHPAEFGEDDVLRRCPSRKHQLADEGRASTGLSHVVYLLIVVQPQPQRRP